MDTPYYVYILRCKGGSLYTGITTDIERRFKQHTGQQAGSAKYTRSRPPLSIEQVWLARDRRSASRLEYRIKTLNKSQKEELILSPALLAEFFGDKLDAADYTPAK